MDAGFGTLRVKRGGKSKAGRGGGAGCEGRGNARVPVGMGGSGTRERWEADRTSAAGEENVINHTRFKSNLN